MRMRIAILLLVLLPIIAGGCSMSELAGHVSGGVSVDPVTGNVVVGVNVKDARQNCRAQNDLARKQLKASYAQARREMDAVEKRELQNLSAQRRQCDNVGVVPVVIMQQPAQPPPIFLPADPVVLPDPINGQLPEEGTFKDLKKECPKQP